MAKDHYTVETVRIFQEDSHLCSCFDKQTVFLFISRVVLSQITIDYWRGVAHVGHPTKIMSESTFDEPSCYVVLGSKATDVQHFQRFR